MNKMQKTTNYRLVAQIKGNALTVNQTLGEEMLRQYDKSIEALRHMNMGTFERNRLIANELESKGDLLAMFERNAVAIRCYIEAMALVASRSIVARLKHKALACAKGNDTLTQLLKE
jgi:hypothetical protein